MTSSFARHADDGDRAGGAGHVERLHDQLGPPDRLERVVGAPTVGEGAHLLDRVAVGRVDGVGGAEPRGSPRGGPAAGSMATMVAAPAMRAPCTTDWPTPPQPITATLEPGRTSAVLSTAPRPVVTPQPSSASCVVGEVGLHRDDRRLVRRPSPRRRCRTRTRRWRVRPSGRSKRLVASTAGPELAVVGHAVEAPPAAAAGGRHRGEHPVADRGPADVGADGLDDRRSPRGRARSAAAGSTGPG